MSDDWWQRQLARDWVNVGKGHDPATWFQPLDDAAAHHPVPLSRFHPFHISEALGLALAGSQKPLIEGLLDPNAFLVIYGESNTGKTFFALDMALQISRGQPYADRKTRQVPVLYLATEGGQGIHKRLAALYADRKVAHDTTAPLFYYMIDPCDLLHADADLGLLIDALKRLPALPGFIVIDTLSRVLAGGNENSSEDMGALVKNLDVLRKVTRATLALLHHSGKNPERGARGHSILRGAIDTEIEVTCTRVAVTKQRDIEETWRSGFALRSVFIAENDDGYLKSAVAQVHPLEAEEPKHGTVEYRDGLHLTATQRLVLQTIERLAPRQSDGLVKTADVRQATGNGARNHIRSLQALRLVEIPRRGVCRLIQQQSES